MLATGMSDAEVKIAIEKLRVGDDVSIVFALRAAPSQRRTITCLIRSIDKTDAAAPYATLYERQGKKEYGLAEEGLVYFSIGAKGPVSRMADTVEMVRFDPTDISTWESLQSMPGSNCSAVPSTASRRRRTGHSFRTAGPPSSASARES